jgi:glycosyltransferase involved in cell wall biosynthesis
LHECLDSVIAQTFSDWEIVAIDDGSSDDSPAILDEYAAKDSRIKVIH